MHRHSQLAGAGRADVRRLKLVGRHRHAQHIREAIADRTELEIVELGEAQLDARPGFTIGWDGQRLQVLQAVEHPGDDGCVVVDLAVGRARHRQLQLLRLDHRRRAGVGQGPAEDLREMVVILHAVGADISG